MSREGAASPPGDLLEAYLDALERRDLDDATDVAFAVLDRGGSLPEAMNLLRAAQIEVGRRWQERLWTVADEHAATSLTERVQAAISAATRVRPERTRVVVACAEGEWHTLPARMFADELAALRWDVSFLGGSVPARHLHEHLEAERPAAVAISCSIPLYLPGAVHSIEAAHEVGIPVLAGGAAFGEDDRRARAVGADAWAAGAEAADEVLRRWSGVAAPSLSAPDGGGLEAQRGLRQVRRELVDEVEAALEQRWPDMRGYDDAQRARTREDLDYLIGFLEAACLTGDVGLLRDYLDWLVAVLTVRGVPAAVLGPTMAAVVESLRGHRLEAAADVLERVSTERAAVDEPTAQ